MYVILPVTCVAEAFFYRSENLVLNHAPEPGYSRFSQRSASVFTKELIEFLITDRLYWSSAPVYEYFIDEVLTKYLPWWEVPKHKHPSHLEQEPTPHAQFCDLYYCEVIDPHECVLREMIEQIITDDKRWCIWYTNPVNQDTMLAQGEDYRIAEFEQRVLSRSIAVSDRAHQHIFEKHLRKNTLV